MKKLLLIILVCVPCFAGWLPNWLATGTAKWRIESLSFTNSASTCTIVRNSGGFASTTYVSAGICTHAITAGVFSATPTCTCAALGNTDRACTIYDATSSTSIQTVTMVVSTGASTDFSGHIICMGPR